MVIDRYQHVRHHPDVTDLVGWARSGKLPLLAVDNLPGARPLETEPLPRACVLLFGQEGSGLSEEARDAADGSTAGACHRDPRRDVRTGPRLRSPARLQR